MMGSGYNTPETPAGPRVRIYELAKELALGHREMVAKVRSLGIEVANHMSHLDPADVDRVRRAVDRERKERTFEERINDTVIRRRSKSVAPVARPAVEPPPARPAPPPVVARAPIADAAVEPPAVVEEPRPAKPRVAPPSSDAVALEPDVAVKPAAPSTTAPAARVESAPAAETSDEDARSAPVKIAAEVAPAASATSSAPTPSPSPTLRTIPQQVVTGSAATGAFIQLPGLAPRGGDAGAGGTPR